MKNIFTVTIIFIFCQLSFISAQNNGIQFGIKLGIQSLSLDAGSIIVVNQGQVDELSLKIKNGNYGFHFGAQIPITINDLIIQPEVVFNSNSVDYEFEELNTTSAFKERYNYIDVPLLLGYQLGFLRLMGGPVGHFFISSNNKLTEINRYEENFRNLTWGYQLGVGLTISKSTLDVRYEGNFQKFGSHITFDDTPFRFDTRPQRILISLGFIF